MVSNNKPTYEKDEVFSMIRDLDLGGLDILEALLQEEESLYPSLMMVWIRNSIQFRRCELTGNYSKNRK